jgi:phosphoribosylformylglycinamidine (FGAM) synthase PurS component
VNRRFAAQHVNEMARAILVNIVVNDHLIDVDDPSSTSPMGAAG